MQKIFLGVSAILVYLVSVVAFSGGGTTHMFLAKEATPKIINLELQSIIKNNFDAYLVGAYYPDSGYVVGGYGEDSHWDKFIYTFADYIKKTYKNPAKENPKLLAFLFGCASHRVSDEIIHWTFYPISAKHDFDGDQEKAHQYGDLGIDLLAMLDKNLWDNHPKTWWVPVKDLVNVYQLMGKNYKAEDIIQGNKIISMAGYGERIIATPLYPFMFWRAPWTAKNYYTWPNGGMIMDELKIAEYQLNLWNRIKLPSLATANAISNTKIFPHNDFITEFGQKAVDSGFVKFDIQEFPDGSIEIKRPIIENNAEFQKLIDELIIKIRTEL